MKHVSNFLINNRRVVCLFILFLIGIGIYANILHTPFQFDDYDEMLESPLVKDLSYLLKNWDNFGRKFIPLFTFALNYHFGGEDTFGYHLVNVLLHILTASVLFGTVRLLCSTPILSPTALSRKKTLFSLFVSLLFLVHPLQTEAVTYIWQRSEVLAGLLYLLAYHSYLLGRLKKKKLYYVGIVFFVGLGFMTKGTIVTLPLMIALTEVSFFDYTKRQRLDIVLAACLILVYGGLLYFRQPRYIFMPITPPSLSSFDRSFSIEYLFTQFMVVMQYIRLSFLPVRQNLDYYFPLAKTFFDGPVILSFLALAAIAGAAIRIFEKHRLMAFGIFWFFIYLIPTSSVLDMGPIWEHRMYLSVAGFSMFIVAFLFTAVAGNQTRNAVAVGVIGLLCVLTVARNNVWRSEFSLMEDTIKKSPLNPRPYVNLGVAYIRKGDYATAVELFKKALSLSSLTYAAPRHNLSIVYTQIGTWHFHQGAYASALAFFRQALRYDPDNSAAYFNFKNISLAEGEYPQAFTMHDKAIESNPYFRGAHIPKETVEPYLNGTNSGQKTDKRKN